MPHNRLVPSPSKGSTLPAATSPEITRRQRAPRWVSFFYQYRAFKCQEILRPALRFQQQYLSLLCVG